MICLCITVTKVDHPTFIIILPLPGICPLIHIRLLPLHLSHGYDCYVVLLWADLKTLHLNHLGISVLIFFFVSFLPNSSLSISELRHKLFWSPSTPHLLDLPFKNFCWICAILSQVLLTKIYPNTGWHLTNWSYITCAFYTYTYAIALFPIIKHSWLWLVGIFSFNHFLLVYPLKLFQFVSKAYNHTIFLFVEPPFLAAMNNWSQETRHWNLE